MRTMSWLLLLMSVALLPLKLSADQGSPAVVVKAYIDACKTGNVAVLKSIIAGPFLERRKLLLETNRDYSAFLKDYHKNIGMEIVAVKPSEDENYGVVLVRQKPLNGSGGSNIELVVRREPGGPWLIFDEKFLE